MPTINEVLNWSLPAEFQSSSSSQLITQRTKYVLDSCIRRLRKSSSYTPYTDEVIEHKDRVYSAIESFFEAAPLGHDHLLATFTRRSVRYLCYGLLLDHPDYDAPVFFSSFQQSALQLLSDKFSSRLHRILHGVLINHWRTLACKPDDLRTFLGFCQYRLRLYSGGQDSILHLKSLSRFFYRVDGPLDLASNLKQRNIPLIDSGAVLGQRDSFIESQYFAAVLTAFTREGERFHNTRRVQEIVVATKRCSDPSVILLVISRLINGAANHKIESILIGEGTKQIGKSSIHRYWQHSNLTKNQNQFAEQARKRLNTWINQKLIHVFFQEVIDDPRRRAFWTKLIDRIEAVQCCGSMDIYAQLRRNSQIGQFVEERFKVVQRSSTTCAIVIYYQDHVFVEFSDTGALYIYLRGTFNSRFRLNSLRSTTDLKITSMPLALRTSNGYYTEYVQEGRLTHQGSWENKLQHWITRYYGKN